MSSEGPLRAAVYTALTHTALAFALTLGVTFFGWLAWSAELVTSASLYLIGGAGGGFAAGFYVGREAAEPDSPTNLGSVLDMLGALAGVLAGWITAHALGWIVF